MSKIKEYYHEEIIAMTKQNQSKQKDDDYQYQQYIESLSQNTEGKYLIVKDNDNYNIISQKEFQQFPYLEISATANTTKDLFAYASLKKILIANTSSYTTKTS